MKQDDWATTQANLVLYSSGRMAPTRCNANKIRRNKHLPKGIDRSIRAGADVVKIFWGVAHGTGEVSSSVPAEGILRGDWRRDVCRPGRVVHAAPPAPVAVPAAGSSIAGSEVSTQVSAAHERGAA